MKTFLINLLMVLGVVVLRFRPVPRIWAIWLMAVNLACVFFLQHIEAQVLLAVTTVAIIGQGVLHTRYGFTRLLGVFHVAWVPMFLWMVTRLDEIAANPALQTWLAVLFATNVISIVVDTVDVTRFIRGERAPHYSWA